MMLNKDLDKDWSTIPDYITSGLLSGLVFIMGITMRGKRHQTIYYYLDVAPDFYALY